MKNQIKKSLSLLMAVLMILSCWVWVAPEKAEAAGDGSYALEISFYIKNRAKNGGHIDVYYHPWKEDGSGLDTTKEVQYTGTELTSGLFSEADGVYVTYTIPAIDGFPSRINVYVSNQAAADDDAYFRTLKVNGVLVADYSAQNSNQGWYMNPGQSDFDKNKNNITHDHTLTDGNNAVQKWAHPYFDEVTEMKSTDVTVAPYPSTTAVNSTVTVIGGVDQYNVEWHGSFPTTNYTHVLKYRDEHGDLQPLDATYAKVTTGSNAPVTVAVYPKIQELFKAEPSGEIYLLSKYGSDEIETPINVKMPTYTASFYPNGGAIGAISSDIKTGEDPVVYGNILYDAYIEQWPMYATREGMELAGYYSEKNNPSTGLVDNFPNGVAYDKDNTKIDDKGNSKWYAAWRAKSYTAHFVVGTNSLGKLTARHGRAMIDGTDMYTDVADINNRLAEMYETSGKKAISFTDTASLGRTPVLNGNVFVGWRLRDYTGSLTDLTNVKITGDVVFEAVFEAPEIAEKQYNITFYNGNSLNSGDILETQVKKFRELADIPATGITKASDKVYDYEFIGWAKNVGKPFYAVDVEGKDETGAYIPYMAKETAEIVAVEDASYVPVFRMTKVPYTVTFSYRENVGEAYTTQTVAVGGYNYGDSVTVPESIKKDYTYNGKRYTIESWKQGLTAFDFDKNTVTGNMTLSAVYDDGEDAVYTIKFIGKDNDGVSDKELNADNNQYAHGAPVVAPEVPQYIPTDDALYVFSGWSPEVTASAKADTEYRAVYEKKVYANVTFVNDGNEIYTISGKNESNEPAGLFVGDVVPVYDEAAYGAPEKDADAVGSYEWVGWTDGSGNEVIPGTTVITGHTVLDAQYEVTKNKYTVQFVVPGKDGEPDVVISRAEYEYRDEVAVPANPENYSDENYNYQYRGWTPSVSEICYGDATYTATYRRSPIYYEINWMDEEKKPYRVSKVAYGKKIQQIVAPTPDTFPTATAGYSWTFKEWIRCNEYGDPLTKVTEANGDVVIKALDLSDTAIAAYKTNILASASTEEAAKINAMNAAEFESYYISNNAIVYSRGMEMDERNSMYFYPTYEELPGRYTVKFYAADGNWLADVQIAHDEDISAYTDSLAELLFDDERVEKLYTDMNLDEEEYHFVFDKWVEKDAADTAEAVTVITGPLSVRAVYRSEKHSFEKGEMTQAPTCLDPGYAEENCTYEYCTHDGRLVEVDRLPDENAPTGKVYIGENKWAYEDTVDFSTKYYVGASATTVVTAEDLGTYGPGNLGKFPVSRGVGKIEYAVVEVQKNDSAEDIAAFDPQTEISVWNNIYDYSVVKAQVLENVLDEKSLDIDDYNVMTAAEKLVIDNEVKAILATYKANGVGKLGDLGLENGKEYVIYIRLSDIEINGTVNYSYLSTGRLHYGTQPANIIVSGDGYGTKFCADAKITVMDDTDGFTVYLDGNDLGLTATTTSVTGASSVNFTSDAVGVHTVTVVDKNGNKSTKTFEIKNGHSYKNFTVAADCENAGSNYDLCSVCGVKANIEVIPATGHKFEGQFTEIAPTCIVDGSRVYVCNNNCGETRVVTYESTDAEFAGLMKYEEGAWVNITKDDLKYLDATGVHTYPKVTDENGKDTTEDAWVIDKAATCVTPGLKHRDCTKCGNTETQEIPVDEVNGHKFSRARTTKPATCTQAGEKTEQCKYCEYSRVAGVIEPLGHDEGKYETTKNATCTQAGEKVLKCTECGVAIADPVEIPKLGHAYEQEGEPVEQADGSFKQTYKCSVCGDTYEEILKDYVKPVEYTVTFKVEGALVQTITKKNGETITAADINGTPTKEEDATYKYSFSHWADKDGNAVAFPVKVEADAEYTAVFKAKNVMYTITYQYEDGKQYKKIGYLNNGTEVTLEPGPAKDATVDTVYTFANWVKLTADFNDEGEIEYNEEDITGNTVTIAGANIVLKAKYTDETRKYLVTYASSMSEDGVIYTHEVKAKHTAPALDNDLIPQKDYDNRYHYTFKGWNKSNQLASVQSNIFTTPEYTAIGHIKDEAHKHVVSEATCTQNQVIKYICDCGYETATIEVKGTATGHSWNTAYDPSLGANVRSCQYGCGATTTDLETYTLNFYVDNTDTLYDDRSVEWGKKLQRIPSAPDKASDGEYKYTFKGWKEIGTADDKIVDFSKLEIKKDYDFIAVYEATELTYVVTFNYKYTYETLYSETVKYGESVTYKGVTPKKEFEGDKGYDPENYCYSFTGWSAETDNIVSDLTVHAVFSKGEHDYAAPVPTGEATCEKGQGTTSTCKKCGYVKEDVGEPKGHTMVETDDRREPSENENGYVVMKCSDCGKTETKVLEYKDTTTKVIVTVERNGAPASNIKVIVQPLGETGPQDATTNSKGIATVTVDKDKDYVAWVVIDGKEISVSLTKNSEGNWIGMYVIETSSNESSDSCSCACHRNNFWGTIFRFFHKIIKMFTGEFKCCKNPDPMYG